MNIQAFIPPITLGFGFALGCVSRYQRFGRNTVFAKDATKRREMKADTAAINNAFDAVERKLARIPNMQRRNVKQHATAGESGTIIGLFPHSSTTRFRPRTFGSRRSVRRSDLNGNGAITR